MSYGVFSIVCDICEWCGVTVIECDWDGVWPVEYAGAECPDCGNMSCYPK